MSVPQFMFLVFSSPINWVLFSHSQAFLDDYCATAAESLLKHVLLRAKGRIALRRLGSSKVSSYDNRAHHERLGDETFSTSSPTSLRCKVGDENKDEGKEAIGRKPAPKSPAINDTSSDNSYDDEDDAFDDSDIDDDDTDQASSTDTTTTTTAPTIKPAIESAPAVPPINNMARNADDSTASTTTPSGSSLSSDVLNAGSRQQQEQQAQQHQLPPQDSTVPTPPSPAHTGIPATPRTSPLRSVAMVSEKDVSNGDGDVPTKDQDRVAYPTGGSGKRGGGDEVGKLRKQAVPVSARR